MASLMLINPKRRTRKKTASPKRRKARRNPFAAAPARRRRSSAVAVRRAVRRARRNPSPRLGGGVMNDVMNAAIGAGGAVAVETIYNFLPLPVAMKTGMGATVGKAATAVALGMFGKRMIGRAAGQMAAGALTVIAYDVIKGLMPAPSVAGLGYMSPAINAGYLPQQGMGEYVTGMEGLGEYVTGTGSGAYAYQ